MSDLENVFGVYHVAPPGLTMNQFLQPQRLWGGRNTTAGEHVDEDSALNYSAVWAATRLLCGTGANLPLPVYKGGNSEEREKDRSHPLYRLLNIAPNSEMTAFNFRSILWMWQVNWGNSYAEIRREGDHPEGDLVDLWPIHPARVSLHRDEDDQLFYIVRNNGKAVVELEPWQMLHIPSILTRDGLVGLGVISHARQCIGAGLAVEKFGAHTFTSGVPRAVIKTAGTWQPEAREGFRKDWEEIYGGADKSRIALLQGGAEIVPLSFSPEDSQFLQTRQFGIEEVARWYGVPPHTLQRLVGATYNNVEQMGIDFVRYCLIPWLRPWEQAISQKLLRPFEQGEYYAEHNVDGLMRGDSAARSSYYKTMIDAALMTRNEARKLENLPPVSGGDTFLTQGANVPLDEDGMPVSEFVNPSDSALSSVADSIKKVLYNDLSRLLTKETNAIRRLSKQENLETSIHDFYADHLPLLREAIKDSLNALKQCGIEVSERFVEDYLDNGKSLILLSKNIEQTIKSTEWVERPTQALRKLEV